MNLLTWFHCSRQHVFSSPGDLLRDAILCEVVIHVMPDFSRRVYVSKIDAPPDVIAKIVESIVRSGVDLGAQHGITIQFQPGPVK